MREVHHDVTVTQGPSPEDEGGGVGAIIRVFLRNPVAAAEVIGFIGGMYGLYYTLNGHVEEAKAATEVHYRDLTAQITQNNKDFTIQIAAISKDLQSSIEILRASDKNETDDIRALQTRGDARYREMLDKMSQSDIAAGKIASGVEYLVRRLSEGREQFVPHDKRGEIGAPGNNNKLVIR